MLFLKDLSGCCLNRLEGGKSGGRRLLKWSRREMKYLGPMAAHIAVQAVHKLELSNRVLLQHFHVDQFCSRVHDSKFSFV